MPSYTKLTMGWSFESSYGSPLIPTSCSLPNKKQRNTNKTWKMSCSTTPNQGGLRWPIPFITH